MFQWLKKSGKSIERKVCIGFSLVGNKFRNFHNLWKNRENGGCKKWLQFEKFRHKVSFFWISWNCKFTIIYGKYDGRMV